MRNHSPTKYLLFMLTVLLAPTLSRAQNSDNWHVYQLENPPLNEAKTYVNKPTISGAAYNMGNGSTLKASQYDRILFFVDGTTTAKTNHETLHVASGDVLFLKAHDFIQFSTSVNLMSWTSKSTKTNHKSKTEKFTKKQIESDRDSSENVWNSFIETSTMVAGLYMLPETLNGDDTLTHDFDEINYVINGSAKFKMNNTVIDVKPGSIIWVKRKVGHYFYDLSDDFDVFILFETIHMNHDH